MTVIEVWMALHYSTSNIRETVRDRHNNYWIFIASDHDRPSTSFQRLKISLTYFCGLDLIESPGVSEMTYNVSSGTLNTTIPYHTGRSNETKDDTSGEWWPCTFESHLGISNSFIVFKNTLMYESITMVRRHMWAFISTVKFDRKNSYNAERDLLAISKFLVYRRQAWTINFNICTNFIKGADVSCRQNQNVPVSVHFISLQ